MYNVWKAEDPGAEGLMSDYHPEPQPYADIPMGHYIHTVHSREFSRSIDWKSVYGYSGDMTNDTIKSELPKLEGDQFWRIRQYESFGINGSTYRVPGKYLVELCEPATYKRLFRKPGSYTAVLGSALFEAPNEDDKKSRLDDIDWDKTLAARAVDTAWTIMGDRAIKRAADGLTGDYR